MYAHRAVDGRRTYEHVLVAERALGKRLPRGAVVHHVDENPNNNDPSNLVLLQSQSEHMLLHAKKRILDAGGDWRLDKVCGTCNTLKRKSEFPRCKTRWDGFFARCKDCSNNARRGKGYSRAARRRAASGN